MSAVDERRAMLETLAREVSTMRTCQQRYFRRPTAEVLRDAKDAERAVDDLIKRLAGPVTEQTSLPGVR